MATVNNFKRTDIVVIQRHCAAIERAHNKKTIQWKIKSVK